MVEFTFSLFLIVTAFVVYFSHFLDGMGLVITIDKQICFIAVNPNRIISFIRLNSIQLVGDTAAQLVNPDIETFPVRQ